MSPDPVKGTIVPQTPVEDKIKLLEAKIAELESIYHKLKLQGVPDGVAKDDKDRDDKRDKGEEDGKHVERNEQTPSSRARVVVNKLDIDSGTRKDIPAAEAATPLKGNELESKFAFQLRKFIYPEEEDEGEVEIFSPELRLLLKGLLKHYPYHHFLGDTVTLSSPYECLVLNWDLLVSEANKEGKDEKDRLARDDLRLLLQTIREGSGDEKLDDYFKLRDTLKASRSITYQNLWTIFPPGILVYSRQFLKHDQIFIVQDNARIWPRQGIRSRFSLSCWTYDWNGQVFQRRPITLSIDYFEGPRPISSLMVHPLEDTENVEEVKQRLLTRGNLFRKYCSVPKESRMFKYAGKCVVDKKGFRGVSANMDHDDEDSNNRGERLRLMFPPDDAITEKKGKQSMVDGDVMVDFESYYKYGLAEAQIGDLPLGDDTDECRCSDCMSNDALRSTYRISYDGKTGDKDEQWEAEQTMLCPPRLLGYVLRDKQWAQLDVNGIINQRQKEEDDAFWEKLKLAGEDGGRETKMLLHGLVKNHGISETGAGYQLNDIVPEKGKGLVILLYGPPGVGKTSTAQTIAVAARKPLFSIGVADVGTSAKLVESNLEKIFDLATTWRAILLIDEADVFLQSRARGQMGPTTERNALVSVFLRVLEYYQGILILTTNQIAQFDVAVQSRIHIAIRYEGLDKKQTVDIFEGFLEQYKRKGLVQPKTYADIMGWVRKELYKKKFDGRQIRNIVTSTMGVASAEGRQMTMEDLNNVVTIMMAFKGDLEYQMRQYEEAQSGARNPYT